MTSPPLPQKTPWRRKLLLSLGAAVLTMAAGEGVLHLLDWRTGETLSGYEFPLYAYRSDPVLGYRFAPDLHAVRFDGHGERFEVRTNSLGLHDEEFPVVKPAGEFRIVCLGGSSTFSSYPIQSLWLTWPKCLQEELRREDPNVRVINAGVPAYTTCESRRNLEHYLLRLSPDLILVNHGWNDVSILLTDLAVGKAWSPRTNGDPSWGVRLLCQSRLVMTARRIYRGWIPAKAVESESTRLRRGHAPLEEIPPDALDIWEREVDGLIEMGRSYSIPVVFVRQLSPVWNMDDVAPTLPIRWQEMEPLTPSGVLQAFREMRRRLSEKPGVQYCPLEDVPEDSSTLVDHCHLTPEGARQQARSLARFLRKHHLLR